MFVIAILTWFQMNKWGSLLVNRNPCKWICLHPRPEKFIMCCLMENSNPTQPNLKLSHPLSTNSLQCVANPLNRRGDLSVEPWVNVTASFVLAPLYAHCIKFCILQICFHLAIALSLSNKSTSKSSSSVTCWQISEVLNNLQRKPERPGVVARCASKQFCLFLLFYFLLFLFHFH